MGVHFSLCVCARDMYVFVWPCGDRSLKSHVLLFCFLSYFLGQGLFTEGGVWHFSPANQWTPRVIASVRPQFWDYGGGGVTTSNNHGYVSSVLLLARQGLHWLSHSPSSLFKDFFFFLSRRNLSGQASGYLLTNVLQIFVSLASLRNFQYFLLSSN